MNRTQPLTEHPTRWTLAALLAGTAVVVSVLALLTGRDAAFFAALPTAVVALAGALLAIAWDARRRTFAWIAALAPVVFVLAVVIHNLEYGLTGVEEPRFVLIAIIGGPALLLAGLAGLLWTTIRNRRDYHTAVVRPA